jgi:anti-sigma B factor antagonist
MATQTRIAEGSSRASVLEVDGELDVATAPGLVASFEKALDERPSEVVVDVSRVEFADSSGIAALIRCRRRAVRCNSRLVLVVGDGAIARLLDLTRLRQVFDTV